MCGRFVQLPLRFSEDSPFSGFREKLTELVSRYNLAPKQRAAVVVVVDVDGNRDMKWLHWGLIPPWAKDLKGSFSTIIGSNNCAEAG